jgi:hypothetical protein
MRLSLFYFYNLYNGQQWLSAGKSGGNCARIMTLFSRNLILSDGHDNSRTLCLLFFPLALICLWHFRLWRLYQTALVLFVTCQEL